MTLVVKTSSYPHEHGRDRASPWFHLTTFLVDRDRDAALLLDEACDAFPDNHSLTWLRARSLVAAGEFNRAMALFDALSRIDVEALSAGSLAFDPLIFGAGAHAALGLCAFRLGRFGESADHYARAEALAPGNLEFRSKRMLAEVEARRATAG